MKYHMFVPIIAILFMNMACDKDIMIESTPEFDVSLDQSTYKVGEEVVFHFSGFAEIISFYSGEVYNDYEFKDARVVDVANSGAVLSFRNAVEDGSQEDQLSILISSSFDGDTGSLADVKSATWIDVTDSLDLADSSDFIESGNLDISQYTDNGNTPVYIAFKYVTEPQMENGEARLFLIENFNVRTRDTIFNDQLTIVNQNETGFQIVDEDPENNPSRTTITSSRLSILGNTYADPNDPIFNPDNPIFDANNPIYDSESDVYDPNAVRPEYSPYNPASPYNDPRRETWIVTKPIFTDKVDLGPDWAKGIRGIRDSKLEEFAYSYSQPGTFNVVFVGKNATIDESTSVVREVKVTIEQ